MTFNIPEFSVSEFSVAIKRIVEDAFGYVRIKGEISGLKRAASGHIYFSLKDENQDAVLSAVCFKNMADSIGVEMADGLSVVASGRVSVFGGRSNYQIIVEKVEIAGLGAIMQMLEKRRQKLAGEGLFDEIHKKKLPFFPRRIAVITSESGAVLQDIIHRINDRFPTNLLVYPSLVQGKDAAKAVINGVKFFGRLKGDKRPDVLIIARGGGSFEDLLSFSDENLVRAVFACEIPVISAIGHETDFSFLDYVADLRAPTPSAAAELATPILQDLQMLLQYNQQRLNLMKSRLFEERQTQINNLGRYIINPLKMIDKTIDRFNNLADKMAFLFVSNFAKKQQKLQSFADLKKDIFTKINFENQKIDHISKILKAGIMISFENLKNRLENLEKLLKAKNYQEILNRGFCLLKNKKGHLISSIINVKTKEEISIELSDGEIISYVLQINKKVDESAKINDLETAEKSEIQPKLI